MKNLVLLQIVILLFMAGCKSDSPTNNNANQITYGPKDPSFENGTDWVYGTSERTSSTGTFMPTKGIWYAKIRLSNGVLYQDNVNLSKCSRLIIDWEAYQPYFGNESFKITFSANGTQELKRIFFSQGDKKSNDTINLPQLPDPGRLSFICETSGSYTKIYIDNIRAE